MAGHCNVNANQLREAGGMSACTVILYDISLEVMQQFRIILIEVTGYLSI